MKLFLNLNGTFGNNQNFFIAGGLDLKLYNTNLSLVDEWTRKTKENSIKLMCSIKRDRFVLATNYDLEIYALALRVNRSAAVEEGPVVTNYIMKLLKTYPDAHDNRCRDSILCLDSISEGLFASGSSDGHLILWNSDSLVKTMSLRPFDELNRNETALRLGSTSIISFKLINQVG
jgi:hypothetical protein